MIDARHKTEKMIVFFTTARMAQFAAALFRKAGYPNVLEVRHFLYLFSLSPCCVNLDADASLCT